MRYIVAAVWLTLWIDGYESRSGYRSLFVDSIHAFALRQTQAHSDTQADKHTSTAELAFKTADINGPNPELVIY